MFGISSPELFVIIIIALIVIGPKHLPELARYLGRGLGELNRAMNDLKKTVNEDEELSEISQTLTRAKNEVTGLIKEEEAAFKNIGSSITGAAGGNIWRADNDQSSEDDDETISGEELKALMVAEARDELRNPVKSAEPAGDLPAQPGEHPGKTEKGK